MHAQIILTMAKLIGTPELMKAEIDRYVQELSDGFNVQATSADGSTVPLLIQYAAQVPTFAQVITSDPPKSVPGPYPVAYIYHIQTEYPPREQEAEIRSGHHRIGLSMFAGAQTPQDAELITELLGSITTKLIERNQYIYGQLPRSRGASTLAYTENEVSGQKLAANVSPFHIIAVVRTKELRLE